MPVTSLAMGVCLGALGLGLISYIGFRVSRFGVWGLVPLVAYRDQLGLLSGLGFTGFGTEEENARALIPADSCQMIRGKPVL